MSVRPLIVFFALTMLTLQSVSAPTGAKHYSDPKPAPGFTLPDLTHTIHRLSDYQGEVLIVSFWATWCVPCVKELPSLTRAADLLQNEGVRVVAVNVGEGLADVERFLARYPSSLMFLLDEQSKISTAWDVRALPTAYVVDKHGRIAMRVIGGFEWDSKAMLRDLRDLALH